MRAQDAEIRQALPIGTAAENLPPALIRSASLRRLPDEGEQIAPAPNPEQIRVWRLADLEQMALGNHPAIASAQAKLNAAHGNWVQVGLKPNPTVGYVADDIGQSGGAGAQGAFFRQQFVRGHKLELNREVAAAAVAKAEAEWATATQRVTTDVRMQFYRTLLAQRRLEVTQQLANVSEQASDAAKRLLDLREGRRVDYLRARIDADRMDVVLREANANHIAAWRALAAIIGLPNLSRRALVGDLDDDLPEFEYDVVAQQLLIESPRIAVAHAEAERTAWAIDRAHAEVVPDLQAGMEIKHEPVSDQMLVVIEAGFQLPLWNKNQGGIQAANAEHAAAVAQISKLELQLRQELAAEFRKYEIARANAVQYSREIIPKSQTTVELAQAGLAAGELTFLDMLTARTALYQANLDYLDALEQLWVSSQRIEGLLLSDSLASD